MNVDVKVGNVLLANTVIDEADVTEFIENWDEFFKSLRTRAVEEFIAFFHEECGESLFSLSVFMMIKSEKDSLFFIDKDKDLIIKEYKPDSILNTTRDVLEKEFKDAEPITKDSYDVKIHLFNPITKETKYIDKLMLSDEDIGHIKEGVKTSYLAFTNEEINVFEELSKDNSNLYVKLYRTYLKDTDYSQVVIETTYGFTYIDYSISVQPTTSVYS